MEPQKDLTHDRWVSIKTRLNALIKRKSSSLETSTTTAKLHIPDEILDKIICHLPSVGKYATPDDLSDLFNTALVSKQWYRVTVPYLYRHLRAGRHGRSARIFATLANKPALGQHTNTLDAKYSALTENLHSRLSIKQSSWAEYMLDPRHQSRAHQDAFYKASFTNALYYLPNLEHLNVGWFKRKLDEEGSPPWLELMQHNSVYDVGLHRHWAEGPIFSNLKRLDAQLQEVPLVELHCIFRLPNIEVVNTGGGKLHSTVKSQKDSTYLIRMVDAWDGIRSRVKHLYFYGLHPGPHHSMGHIARAVPQLETLHIVGTPEYQLGANLLRAILSTFMLRDIDVCKLKRLKLGDVKPTVPNIRTQTVYMSAYLALTLWYEVEELIVDLPVIQAYWMHHLSLPKKILCLKVIVHLTEDSETVDLWTMFKVTLREAIDAKAFPELEMVKISLRSHVRLANEYVRWDGNKGYEANGVKVIIGQEPLTIDYIPRTPIRKVKALAH